MCYRSSMGWEASFRTDPQKRQNCILYIATYICEKQLLFLAVSRKDAQQINVKRNVKRVFYQWLLLCEWSKQPFKAAALHFPQKGVCQKYITIHTFYGTLLNKNCSHFLGAHCLVMWPLNKKHYFQAHD